MNTSLVILGVVILAGLFLIKNKSLSNVLIFLGIAALVLGICVPQKSKEIGEKVVQKGKKVAEKGGEIVVQEGADLVESYSNSLCGQLKEKGWIFFGNNQCPWCTKQKSELGEEFGLVFVDVQSPQGQEIIGALGINVDGVPYWHNPKLKKSAPGFQDKEKLKNLIQ